MERSRPQNRSAVVSWLFADGWTLMIVLGPGQRTRRVHVPRWALAGLCCLWLGIMCAAAWLGFESV